jgi:hypothetical protein
MWWIGKIVQAYMVYLARREPLQWLVNLAENLQIRRTDCRSARSVRHFQPARCQVLASREAIRDI